MVFDSLQTAFMMHSRLLLLRILWNIYAGYIQTLVYAFNHAEFANVMKF